MSCLFKSCQARSYKPMESTICTMQSTHTHLSKLLWSAIHTHTKYIRKHKQSHISVLWSLISVPQTIQLCVFPGWCVWSGADHSVVHRLPVIDPGFLPGVPGWEGWRHRRANRHWWPLPDTSHAGLWHLCRCPLVGTGENYTWHSHAFITFWELGIGNSSQINFNFW